MTAVLLLVLGGGLSYWYFGRPTQDYSEVYKQLDIAPLPSSVERNPKLQSHLSQLKREPCFLNAVLGLSSELMQAGYPRESAVSVLAFGKRCGTEDNISILRYAYSGFNRVSDFKAALQIIQRMVDAYPADANFRYSRGVTHERLRMFSPALSDYIAAVQLLGKPSAVDPVHFYDISRMYAALGRHCDAIPPLETHVSFNPIKNRTAQLTKVISEYAERGRCETNYARGTSRVRLFSGGDVHTLTVVVNGVAGNFMLDTGASYVTVTPEFSAKAKLSIEAGDPIPLKTVGGSASADLGYAKTVSVGSAEATGVVITVIRGSKDPFGGGLDGLLGMSFLSRFNVRVSQDGIELAAVSLR